MKFGHRFIVEPSSVAVSPEERQILKELSPAGIMLRSRNILQDKPHTEWLSGFAELIADLRSILGPDCIISVDHEGGRIIRFPEPITRFPYPHFYGEDLELTAQIARATARELVSLGVNLVFAPVADIASNADNPVIGERSFGSDPKKVADSCLVFLKSLQENGLVGCPKHFPGHGDTSKDSHFELPVVLADRELLEARELVPFKTLIKAGALAVMSGHLMLPKIDSQKPATTSKIISGQILRKELGFSGVLITDALAMQAISESLDSGTFARDCDSAGVDLLLYCGPGLEMSGALKLAEEFESSGVSGEESKERINSLRAKLLNNSVFELSEKVFNEHAKLCENNGQKKQIIPDGFN